VNLDVFHNPNPAFKPRPAEQDGDQQDFKVVAHRSLVPNIKQNTSPATKKSLLTTRRVGEFFGARSLRGEPNHCQAVSSAVKTVCLKLTKPNWDIFVAKHKQLEQRILKCLSVGLEDALKTLQYLSQVDPAKLQLMAAAFRFITVEKDAQLFKRGDIGSKEGNSLHYMLEGEVKVQVLDESDGEEKVVAIVKKLQFFGEVGLVVHLPRTSTVTARKKCLFLELTQTDFRNFAQICPEVLDAFRDGLEHYNIPLRYLIHNPILQEYLLKCMLEEKSAENIQYWMAAKDFRMNDNKDPDVIREQASEIVEKHIREGSDAQVNINGSTRKEIVALFPKSGSANPQPIGRDVLQKAEEEVLVLMSRDTFTRFKSSKLFQECLSKMTSTPNYQPKKAESKPKAAAAASTMNF